MDDSLSKSPRSQIEGTRSKFAAMAGVYFFGSLNDNFYRQAAMLLVVGAGLSYLQSWILFLFTLPFIIFASLAGFLADRFSKRSVIISARLSVIIIFIIGAAGLYFSSWPAIMCAVFIFGLQATILSPALNGSIPELYPPEHVVTANGIFCVVNNAAIMLGIAGAGFVLDVKGTFSDVPLGQCVVAGLCVLIAVITFFVSIFVPEFPAASPASRLTWRVTIESVVTLLQTRRDSLLANSIFAKAFFWFAGSLQILIINSLGVSQLGLTKAMTSTMIVVEIVGIGVGSLLSPVLAKGPKWYRVIVPSSLLMAGALLAVWAVPFLPAFIQKVSLAGALMILGIAAGIFSIPVTSFVQIRPAPELKGRMIAASNLADFVGILLSSAVFYIFNLLSIKPSNCFAIEALMVTAVTAWLWIALPKETA